MDKLGDITLFVKIVQFGGLATAGRDMGISPASVSSRLTRLEEGYGVRLINRTTRKISLTDEGKEFFNNALNILSELERAEAQLTLGQTTLTGRLKITAPIDIGKQHIAPLLGEFIRQNPAVSAHLDLSDHVVDFVEGGFDLAIRYGIPIDSNMVAKKLSSNHRLLCASLAYLEKYGKPKSPKDLLNHRCLIIERDGEALNHWHFDTKGEDTKGEQESIIVPVTLSSNDGSQIRKWALNGLGIALKSYCDVEADLQENKLIPILDEYQQNYQLGDSDLNAVYLSRKFMPDRTRAFIDMLASHFNRNS